MKPMSYKVAGRTHEEDKHEWSFGKCKNENGCWGPFERIFDVKITEDNKYCFLNTKVLPDLNEEVVDKFFIKLERNLRTFPSDVIVQDGIGWFPRHPMERLSNLSLFIQGAPKFQEFFFIPPLKCSFESVPHLEFSVWKDYRSLSLHF